MLSVAEGVGFEPTVAMKLRSISSRVPLTGLSHPSVRDVRYYVRSVTDGKEK